MADTVAPTVGDGVRALRASPIFAFYIFVALAVAGVIGLITVDVIDLGMSHFGDRGHRTHDVTYGLLFTTVVVGVAVQLWPRADDTAAAMWMAVIPPAALALAAVLATDIGVVLKGNPLRYVGAVTIVAALLHPAGRGFVRSFGVARISWAMAAMTGLAAVPLLAYAATNIDRQRTVDDVHAAMGHYGFGAAFGFTVVGVALLASLRPAGWQIPAYVAAALPVLLGVTSLLYPDVTSSVTRPWAVAAVGWGAAFLAVALLTAGRGRRQVSG